ncbi:PREDICTED: UDP-glucuronosyltransferase 2B17-like [Chinchilla lanigera]|uniref:UDP-glucuronosyltransferase 2B17-like n=1 Tax=Chinchilla lanigera TaxID=34839 RepID=UPI00038ECEA4|nr:PREDICTED: UDP-glucuronosyltransferase 2B17-like [Chinchilla lanigera]
MSRVTKRILLLLPLCCYFSAGSCGRVLVWHMEFSHWLNAHVILTELVQRGHQVTVLRPSSSAFLNLNSPSDMKFETFPTSSNTEEMRNFFQQMFDTWIYNIQQDAHWKYFPLLQSMFWEFSDIYYNISKDAVLNKKLLTKLQELKFDVLLVDVTFSGGDLETHYISQSMEKAETWLIQSYWDLEFPCPTLPNIEFVGGLHCKPAKSLPKEMEHFVQSSGEHGVVVFSLGSMVHNLTEERANVIASALAQLPQKVIWRYNGKTPDTLQPNTQLHEWIPQNDLLGHPKTKAFITHGGANGICDAINHGVPMVGIPLFGEQHDNIAHIEAKGAAVVLDFKTMSTADLVNALKEVMNNPFFKQNVMRLSTIHHDQLVKPLDRAVFWIEFVMRHKGAKHLRPLAQNLTWYQYHSLDVIGFLLACVVTVTLLVTKCCLFYYQKTVEIGKKKKE